jgi:hypothetical protein
MNQFVTLLSWDPSMGALTYDVNGVQHTSTVQESTNVHRAALNRYQPGDPILPIVKRWNTQIEAIKGPSTFGPPNPPLDIPNPFSEITSDLVANQAKMQINLKPNSSIIESLRPIPVIPPNPI